MSKSPHSKPKNFLGVTISSTFTDLKDHRAALINVIKKHGMMDIAMENSYAQNIDVIESSYQFVRDGAAYICVISRKYGQVPESKERNPDGLSITELEFNEALRLKRPICLFIMGDKHLVFENDIELNEEKRDKLNAFRERAKIMDEESLVHRVYASFNSLEEFKEQINPSIAKIVEDLQKDKKEPVETDSNVDSNSDLISDTIPVAPAFYAEPSYIGSHKFVGRLSQLETLNDWARPADPHTILLFEAIGGNGKSMLTWEWVNNHAKTVRKDWAGIFWYSFYEKGAVMSEFCRYALAYITGHPLKKFIKKRTPELKELLLHHLKMKPWLFILDGLERVLVAYHRIDAAEIPDEDLNNPTDKIISRDPCSCIDDQDDDLLRFLATVSPSKILITSRLVPRVLLNNAHQPIPGVQRILLTGLRPADAEALFRSAGIVGDTEAIQNYLITNCDCHPLTIGVLAGIINNYLPNKGNFDVWLADPSDGGQLNLANLDPIQKRNHILKAALRALPNDARKLLATIALLSEAVDYKTIAAFNPHLPPEPIEVIEPQKPESFYGWEFLTDIQKSKKENSYKIKLVEWKKYLKAMEEWEKSIEYKNAFKKLKETILDLELRGLMQYDHQLKRYDLHPVVRGVAAGSLKTEETEEYGQRVVDYFSIQSHDPYEQADSLQDLQDSLYVVRTLLKMKHYQKAWNAFSGSLSNALLFNLEANNEVLKLLRPFYSKDWHVLTHLLDEISISSLMNATGVAINGINKENEALKLYSASIELYLKQSESIPFSKLNTTLRNFSTVLWRQNNFASEERILNLSLTLSILDDDSQALFKNRLCLFVHLTDMGKWHDAKKMWNLLDPMGRDWSRSVYRPGDAEESYANFLFYQGELTEEYITNIEKLAIEGKNRATIRSTKRLKGRLFIEQSKWEPAITSFNEALRMARIIGDTDSVSETWLAFAKFNLGELSDPVDVANDLSKNEIKSNRALAELWIAIGNKQNAKKYALEAYKSAWANGEPYVYRYELNKSIELLNKLGVGIPKFPSYDPSKDEKFPWEDKVVALIEKLKQEN